MTEKEYKQLFLDPRYQNLSLHSTKDNLVYLVQDSKDTKIHHTLHIHASKKKFKRLLLSSERGMFRTARQ